jgi:hypothetical protein
VKRQIDQSDTLMTVGINGPVVRSGMEHNRKAGERVAK